MREDSKKDAEALQIHRRALQAYCMFSKREEATNIECQGGGANIRRRGGITLCIILPQSSVNMRGLIPVWQFLQNT